MCKYTSVKTLYDHDTQSIVAKRVGGKLYKYETILFLIVEIDNVYNDFQNLMKTIVFTCQPIELPRLYPMSITAVWMHIKY